MENKIITDYFILEYTNATDLNDSVKTNIENGWQPYGHLFQTSNGNLIQAMVIYKDEIEIKISEKEININNIDNLLKAMP